MIFHCLLISIVSVEMSAVSLTVHLRVICLKNFVIGLRQFYFDVIHQNLRISLYLSFLEFVGLHESVARCLLSVLEKPWPVSENIVSCQFFLLFSRHLDPILGCVSV